MVVCRVGLFRSKTLNTNTCNLLGQVQFFSSCPNGTIPSKTDKWCGNRRERSKTRGKSSKAYIIFIYIYAVNTHIYTYIHTYTLKEKRKTSEKISKNKRTAKVEKMESNPCRKTSKSQIKVQHVSAPSREEML